MPDTQGSAEPRLSTAEVEERLARLFSDACAELLRVVEATVQLMQDLDEIESRVDRLETALDQPAAHSGPAPTLH